MHNGIGISRMIFAKGDRLTQKAAKERICCLLWNIADCRDFKNFIPEYKVISF